MSRARSPRPPRPPRALAPRALALVAAIALLAVNLVAGARYFACLEMDRVMFAACCPEHAHDASDGPAIDGAACCQPRHFDGVPAGAPGAAPAPLVAPLVAILAAPPPVPPPALETIAARRMPIRAGPDRPLDRAAVLQVFLC